MSQAGSRQSSFFSRLSIRQKLFFSFLLILIFISIQSFVSINSSQVFTQNYNNIQIQQTIEARTADLRDNVRLENNIVDSWLFGTSLTAREEYNDVNTSTNSTLVAIQELLATLRGTGEEDPLNVSFADSLISDMKGQLETVNNFVVNSIFKNPSSILVENLTRTVTEIGLLGFEINSKIMEFIFTNDTSILAELQGPTSSPEILIQKVTTFSTINGLISDPDDIQGRITGLNINQTLFEEFDRIRSRSFDLNAISIRAQIGAISNLVNGTILEISPELSAEILTELEDLIDANDGLTEGVDDATGILDVILTKIQVYDEELDLLISSISDKVTELLQWIVLERNELSQEFASTFANQTVIILTVIILSILLVLIIQYFINSQISRPVKSITLWSQLISEGDLSKTQQSTGRSDEIGVLQDNFRLMNKNLREIINEVQTSSSLITSTSEDLSTSAQEINATAEEVSAIAQTMAKGSTEQAEIITSIVQELQAASDVVENVVIQITENLDIIKDLSEQTNILALNTAIEAANAGDMARGFQVIAENIRKMSEQSKRTSKRVSKDSREILEQLRDSFNHITNLIENVASVSEETAASAEEVAASAEEMTASMESIAASSAILSDQSTESLDKVNRFKLDI